LSSNSGTFVSASFFKRSVLGSGVGAGAGGFCRAPIRFSALLERLRRLLSFGH
jgi:hypothetical protein